jgi:hypothetical protein
MAQSLTSVIAASINPSNIKNVARAIEQAPPRSPCVKHAKV